MNKKDLIKNLMSGETDLFTSGLSDLISQRATDMVNDYKAVAFSDIQESGNFAGWIAKYKDKTLEIDKSEANSISDAKRLAILKLKIPKSKVGLLAIKAAVNEDVEELEEGKLKYGQEYPKAKIIKMIRDGEWESMTDIKPGRAIEMQHVDSGKKVMIYVKEETL